MGRFSDIDADLYSANENFYGFQPNPEFYLEEIHVILIYNEETLSTRTYRAYTEYDRAIEELSKLELKHSDNVYYIETIPVN